MVGGPLPVRIAGVDGDAHAASLEPRWQHKLANFALFQLAWLAAVFNAAEGYAWLGSAAIGVAVIAHLVWARSARRELALLVAVTLMGLVVESLQLRMKLIAYAGGEGWAPWPPPWLLLMWTLLATTLNLSLRWLHGRWLLASIFGAVGGPASFVAGVHIGAARFVDASAAMAVQAVSWALLMPLMLAIAQRLDGMVTGIEGAAHA